MQNNEYDFIYPGDNKGKELFYELEELSARNKYDDDYLVKLIEYQKLCPESTNFDIFYAKYALFHGNHDVALEYATKAEKIWRNNLEIWKILVQVYKKRNQTREQLVYLGYCSTRVEVSENLCLSSDAEQRDRELLLLSKASGTGDYFPACVAAFFLTEQGLIKKQNIFRAGDFFPLINEKNDPYFIGAYVEDEYLNGKAYLLQTVKDIENILLARTDVVFDARRSKKSSKFILGEAGKKYIVPVAGDFAFQPVKVEIGGNTGEIKLGKWEYSLLRLEDKVKLSSEKPFIVGKPILLGHSPKRKKIVLNILADALPWAVIKRHNYEWIPNIMKFFEKGVIFDNHFSASEFTYPSLTTIETGLYPFHHKMQCEAYSIELPFSVEPISEKMNSAGYYSTNLHGYGFFTGATRGYDRQVLNHASSHTYVAVERIIRQLEAFDECDNFIYVHLCDPHPMDKILCHFADDAQTHMNLVDKIADEKPPTRGVGFNHSPTYINTNILAIKMVDRTLKTLFDYIEEHYSEDEYIVQLYSDHGNFVHSVDRYMLKEDQTHASYLVRGAGVPSIGIVDELTSTADIYAVLGHLADYEVSDNVDSNLPEVFGGTRRDHVISTSVMPGQSYKLCIRTETLEFRLKSKDKTDWDCTADLTNADCELYDRKTMERIAPNREQIDYFFGLVKKYTQEQDNHGHVFSSLKRKSEE